MPLNSSSQHKRQFCRVLLNLSSNCRSQTVKAKEKQRRGVFLYNTQGSRGSLLNAKRCFSCHFQQKEAHKITECFLIPLTTFPASQIRTLGPQRPCEEAKDARAAASTAPGVPWAPLPADLRLPIACSAALQQLRSHLPVLILSLTRPRRRLSLTGVCVGFTTPRQPPSPGTAPLPPAAWRCQEPGRGVGAPRGVSVPQGRVLRDGSPQSTASSCSISARQREKTETMAGNQKEARRIASAYLRALT